MLPSMRPYTSRVRVKICGITNAEDAEAAIDAGADALGFNGFPGSKRYIDLARASTWIAQLPPFVTRVAVLVNPTLADARAVGELPGLDRLQFHGDESPEFCRVFPANSFIKAVAARDPAALERCEEYGRYLLLDAFVAGEYGGTGQLIDLKLASAFVREHPNVKVILSGGLTPENVVEAVRVTEPYAVDVASGVESRPGRKDHVLVRAFIAALKEFSCE